MLHIHFFKVIGLSALSASLSIGRRFSHLNSWFLHNVCMFWYPLNLLGLPILLVFSVAMFQSVYFIPLCNCGEIFEMLCTCFSTFVMSCRLLFSRVSCLSCSSFFLKACSLTPNTILSGIGESCKHWQKLQDYASVLIADTQRSILSSSFCDLEFLHAARTFHWFAPISIFRIFEQQSRLLSNFWAGWMS